MKVERAAFSSFSTIQPKPFFFKASVVDVRSCWFSFSNKYSDFVSASAAFAAATDADMCLCCCCCLSLLLPVSAAAAAAAAAAIVADPARWLIFFETIRVLLLLHCCMYAANVVALLVDFASGALTNKFTLYGHSSITD